MAIFQVNLDLPVFIEAKDDGGDGDNWTTGAISRAKIQSNITTNKPTSIFLQAGCPSCRQTNSVKALNARCSVLVFSVCLSSMNKDIPVSQAISWFITLNDLFWRLVDFAITSLF